MMKIGELMKKVLGELREAKLCVHPPLYRQYVDAKGADTEPKGYIAAIVCEDADGRLIHNVSLEEAKKSGVDIDFQSNGTVAVNGHVYYLHSLFHKEQADPSLFVAFLSVHYPDYGLITVLSPEELK